MDWMYLIIKKPAYQALLFCLLTPITILVLQPKDAEKAWTISMFIYFLFLLINSGLMWFSENPWRYFFYSIGVALAYILPLSLFTQISINILKLKGSSETAMAFLAILYQPPALLLVMFAKWIATKWF